MIVLIYSLTDPRNGRIRYVGKASGPLSLRLSDHISSSRAERSHKAHWIRQLIKLGLKPAIAILETCDESCWQDRERFWIAELRQRGERLTNSTDGGDGGKTHSEESRERMRRAAARRWSKQHERDAQSQRTKKRIETDPELPRRAALARVYTPADLHRLATQNIGRRK